MKISFSADYADNGEGSAIALKISSDSFELNVWLLFHELPRLDDVLATRWESGAIGVGRSAGSPAWWSCDDGEVAICVGADDQTWDFSIAFPASEFASLRESIAILTLAERTHAND